MTYDNVPFFVGLPNSGISSIGDGSGYMLPCNSVVAEQAIGSKTIKTLGRGVKRKERVNTDNFLVTNIQAEFYFLPDNQMDNGYGFLFDNWNDGGLQRGSATGNNFFPIMYGGNVYDECYIENYSINIKPHAPVTCVATFKSLKPPKSVPISGYTGTINDYYNQNMNGDNFVFGHTCYISGLSGQVLNDDLVTSLTYDKRYNSTQTSCIYDTVPKRSLVNSVEGQLNIQSTGFKKFMPYSGYFITGDISIQLQDLSGNAIGKPSQPNGFEVRVQKGSLLDQESLGVRGSDASITRLQIKDSIL